MSHLFAHLLSSSKIASVFSLDQPRDHQVLTEQRSQATMGSWLLNAHMTERTVSSVEHGVVRPISR